MKLAIQVQILDKDDASHFILMHFEIQPLALCIFCSTMLDPALYLQIHKPRKQWCHKNKEKEKTNTRFEVLYLLMKEITLLDHSNSDPSCYLLARNMSSNWSLLLLNKLAPLTANFTCMDAGANPPHFWTVITHTNIQYCQTVGLQDALIRKTIKFDSF